MKKIEWDDPAALYRKPVLCLLGPKGKTIAQLPKELSVCISSKYKNTAEKYLEKLETAGFRFRKIYVTGCVETGYAEGIADIAIDIVYSGSSVTLGGQSLTTQVDTTATTPFKFDYYQSDGTTTTGLTTSNIRFVQITLTLKDSTSGQSIQQVTRVALRSAS